MECSNDLTRGLVYMGQAERTKPDEAVGCLCVSETGRYKQDPELTRP